MALTINNGKKFISITFDASGGNYVMDKDYIIRAVRLTNIGANDYMTFYEPYGDNPKLFRLSASNPVMTFSGKLSTKLAFNWSECSLANPTTALLSIEVE